MRIRILLTLSLLFSLVMACNGTADATLTTNEKVIISDIVSWQHPTKPVFERYGFQVTKVELYEDGTYPVFYLQPGSRVTIYNYTFLSDVAQKNGFWNYKVVSPNGFVEVYCDKDKERVTKTKSDIGEKEFDTYDLKTAPKKAAELVIQYKKLMYNSETDDYAVPGKSYRVKLMAGGFDENGRYEIRICPSYYPLSVFNYCYVDLKNEVVYIKFDQNQ